MAGFEAYAKRITLVTAVLAGIGVLLLCAAGAFWSPGLRIGLGFGLGACFGLVVFRLKVRQLQRIATMSPKQATGYLMMRSFGKLALYAVPLVLAWAWSTVFNWVGAAVGVFFPTIVTIIDAGSSFRLGALGGTGRQDQSKQ